MNKDITPFPWSVLGDRNGWLRIGHGTNCSIATNLLQALAAKANGERK